MSCHGFIILLLLIIINILNLQHHTPAAPAPVHSRGEHRDPDCSLKHLIGGYDDYDYYGDYDYHDDYDYYGDYDYHDDYDYYGDYDYHGDY